MDKNKFLQGFTCFTVVWAQIQSSGGVKSCGTLVQYQYFGACSAEIYTSRRLQSKCMQNFGWEFVCGGPQAHM